MKTRRAVFFIFLALLLSIFVNWSDLRYVMFDGPQQKIEIQDFSEFICNDCKVDEDGAILITGEDPWIWILGQDIYIGKIEVIFQKQITAQNAIIFYWDTGEGFSDAASEKVKLGKEKGTVFIEEQLEKLRIDFEGIDQKIMLERITVNPTVDRMEKLSLIARNFVLALYFSILIFSTELLWNQMGRKPNWLFWVEIGVYLWGGAMVAVGTFDGWQRAFSFLGIWLFSQFITCISVGISNRITTFLFFAALLMVYMLWLGTIPFNGAPDEAMRFLIPKYIYNHGRLPIGTDPEIRHAQWGTSYGFTPTICYVLSALFMKIGDLAKLTGEKLFLAARLASVVYSMAAAVIVRKIGKLLFEDPFAWVFTAIIMLLPQYTFVSGYVNCDAFGMLGTALLIWQVLKGKEKNFPIHSCIGIGAGISVCLLSYYNTYGMILVFCIYCVVLVLGSKKEDRIKKLILSIVIVGITAAILSGWWFVRNYFLYDGDFLGLRSSSASMESFGKEALRPSSRVTMAEQGMSVLDMMFKTKWWPMTLDSFVGVFGMMKLWMPSGIYVLYYGMLLLGLGGNLLLQKSKCRDYLKPILIASMIVTIAISVYYSWCKDFQPQGRYILPILIPLGILVTDGYRKLTISIPKKIQNSVVSGMLILIVAGSFAAFLSANAGY